MDHLKYLLLFSLLLEFSSSQIGNQSVNFTHEVPIAEGGNVVLNENTSDDYETHCLHQKCIRKCCPENHAVKGKKCVQLEGRNFTLMVYEGTDPVNETVYFNVIHWRKCKSGPAVRLTPKFIKSDVFYLQSDGTLLRPFEDDESVFDFEGFCMDLFYGRFGLDVSALVCLRNLIIEPSSTCSIGMIISMPFLFITFVAYALLPDRNLHMKALMIYVMNLLLGYIFLVVLQLSNGTIETSTCKAFGYLCIFLLMSSFLWMNVICIDIWFAFSGLRGFSGTKRAENKRFLIYNAYAWGTATLITLIVVIMNEMNTGAAWYVPGIAQGQCFLALGYPELLYFYGPMAIIITINVILFAMTAFKIRAVKKETSMLKKDDSKRHSYENDKQKFNLYLKLLFAMGVNWSLEIISWAVAWKVAEAPKYIWYLTDFCNAIYGVFIFFIFVFKRSIWKLLKKRYYSFRGQTNLAHSMTTNPTRTTSYSTTSTAARDSQPGGSHTSTLLTTTTET